MACRGRATGRPWLSKFSSLVLVLTTCDLTVENVTVLSLRSRFVFEPTGTCRVDE
jgi:hypothetical protein